MKRNVLHQGPVLLGVSAFLCLTSPGLYSHRRASIEAAQGAPGAQTLFEGGRLISGDGGAPLDGSAILVDGETILKIGKKGEVQLPPRGRRVDLTGKTVMPGLV